MAYITEPLLRERLPLDGEGVSDSEIDEAIDSAVEYVSMLLGDTEGTAAVARNAVAMLAHADVLDIIFPRDTRATDSAAVILRQNAESLLKRYIEAKKDLDSDPTTKNPSVGNII